jgi:hypothetical protein
MSRKLDITGQRFGLLVVVQASPLRQSNGGCMWDCICDCGKTTTTAQWNLKNGGTKSCGCLKAHNNFRHGKAATGMYDSWVSMIQRCTNPNSPAFEKYGKCGISVCERWLSSFKNFLEDMGERPEGTSIDRIDPTGNYEPSNCRWANKTEQMYNQNLRNNNTSGKSGVYFREDRNKWYARISKERKHYHLGHFDTFEEAVAAREKAELELYGYNKQ